MVREHRRQDGDSEIDAFDSYLLPSRLVALDACRSAAAEATGPILISGDSGVGTTWLRKRLTDEADYPDCWAAIDVSPLTEARDFHRLIARELGLDEDASGRLERERLLGERSLSGERWTLAIDEAQNLSPALWREVEILVNQLREPNGFTAIFLVGRSSLVRTLGPRSASPIAARVSRRIHLRPIDADEALELVSRRFPGRSWDIEAVERLHRDVRGVPLRFLREAEIRRERLGAPSERPIRSPWSPSKPSEAFSSTGKPPILEEEGLIEVGWTDPVEETVSDKKTDAPAPEIHAAALTAWREWAAKQDRETSTTQAHGGFVSSDLDDAEESLFTSDPPSALDDLSNVRAEGRQSFSPYGRLFASNPETDDAEASADA